MGDRLVVGKLEAGRYGLTPGQEITVGGIHMDQPVNNPSARPFMGTIGTPIDDTPTPTPPVMNELHAAKRRLIDSLSGKYADLLRDIPPEELFRMRAMGAWPIYAPPNENTSQRMVNTTDGGVMYESPEDVARRTGVREPEAYAARSLKRMAAREAEEEGLRLQDEARRAQAPQGLDRLLAERAEEYHVGATQAWALTGDIVKFVGVKQLERIIESGAFYNWITILCKLIRALATPYKRDHWADIEGYAHLVVDRIDSDAAIERGG